MAARLHSRDLQHLRLLHLLLQERSVTRVSEQAGLSQPALSRMLARLRAQLGDSLLLKSGASMALTERGEQLRAPLQDILARVDALHADVSFSPSSAQQRFAVGVADCLVPSFIARLVARIVAAAPGVTMEFRTIDRSFDASSALEDGSLDLIINNHPRPREDLRTSHLYTDEVVCLMRQGHPLAASGRRLRLARYLSAQHIAPNPSTNGEAGPIMGSMLRCGYRRHIVATIPEYNLVAHMRHQTDFVFTTGRRFAASQCALAPLVMVPAPVEFSDLKFYQLWHQRKHGSVSNRWLREQVREVARTCE